LLIPLTTSLKPLLGSHAGSDDFSKLSFLWKTFDDEDGSSIIGTRGLLEGSSYPDFGDYCPTHCIEVAPEATFSVFRVFVARHTQFADRIGKLMATIEGPADFTPLLKSGPARWPETVTTTGEVSAKTDEAYVVDTIKLPDPNPWGAPMFVGGFDFFPDGRAAVCTFHGDVFIVDGLGSAPASGAAAGAPPEATAPPRGAEDHARGARATRGAVLQTTWKRFASGLYHALGLKIVNGEIYVTCRDGLWRLKDLNGDGECDFYEAFNFDLKATKNFHELSSTCRPMRRRTSISSRPGQ
jgi:hypothetical protein